VHKAHRWKDEQNKIGKEIGENLEKKIGCDKYTQRTRPNIRKDWPSTTVFLLMVSNIRSLLFSVILATHHAWGTSTVCVLCTMLKAANTVVKLHNCNLDNFLPTEVHASVTDFLTSSDNKVLNDEVTKELEAPPCNLIRTGLETDCHGANVQDPYLCTFISGFHIKMASLFGLTPLPLLGRPHNFLLKPVFFSPLLQSLW